VTGANGFLGRSLVAGLLATGRSPAALRCLVRDPERAAAAGIPRSSMWRGDLADAEALATAADGVDLVLHLAGAVRAWNRRGYDQANNDGTQRLVAAVTARAPAAHFVLVSSLAAAGPSVDGSGSEQMPDRCHPVSAYGESKRRGELTVVGSKLAWTIVRPPVVYGPGDAATQLLVRQACAPLCLVPPRPRPLSVISVRDVTTALLLAADCRPRAAVLPLDGPERTDTHALLRAIAAACGRRARLLPVPLGIAAAVAGVCDVWASLTHRASFFSGDKIKELRADGWVADGVAARALLAFVPMVTLAAGLLEVAVAAGRARAPGGATSTIA